MTEIHDCRGAIISECGLYRYDLWRTWDASKPSLSFVMLNPSTADAMDDDPTIRRCIGFAKRDGFGGISVKNLFAWRDSKPAALLKSADPFGPDNRNYLLACQVACPSSKVVAAWGKLPNSMRLRELANQSVLLVRKLEPYCLGKNKDGSPRHPLFLPANTEIVPWST